MAVSKKNSQNAKHLQIKGYLNLEYYHITEGDLMQLQQALGSGPFLDFGLFFTALAVGFFTYILSADIKSIEWFNITIIITTLSFVLGIIFSILWFVGRRKVKLIVRRIKRQKILLAES